MSNYNVTRPIDNTGTVISKDGTVISYQITGKGPGLILIHGVLSRAGDYNKLANILGQCFTVYSIDRRGRGGSGPQGENYSIVSECEDVEAVLSATKSCNIFGHSFGGLVALEVSRNNPEIRKVAIYEAAVCIDNSISIAWIPAYKNSLDKGRYFEAFSIFSIGAGPEKARKTPLWLMKLLMPFFVKKNELNQKYSLLSQNIKEHQVVAQQNNSFNNYKEISANVLIMSGRKSESAWVKKSLSILSEVIPHSELYQFPTLDHFGPDKSGPDEVAMAVTDFLQRM